MPLRIFCSAALLALVAVMPAAAAHRSASGISPGLVHRGQKTTLSVRVPGFTGRCIATLTYSDHHSQRTSWHKSHNGRVSFVVTVPRSAALGGGAWLVQCGLGTSRGTFVVVGPQSKSKKSTTPRVVVASQGFSQRPDSYGTGSNLSYGIVLRNTSAAEDADNVYVIVNMVAADGSLIGSESQTVDLVPAGGTYALGDSLGLRTQTAATHLEIVVRVLAHQPKQANTMPDLANVRLEPSQYDPGFVGEVDGEVVNDTSTKTLSSASMSIVVLDASGNPVGGGTGSLYTAVPSGARFVFTASSGFNAIPLDKAATVLVSLAPRYTTT